MKLIKNDKLECQIADVAEVAGYLWQRGWAERNGGNISVNITDLLTDEEKVLPAISERYPLPKVMNALKGNFFLVTGTNRRMRYVASHPMEIGMKLSPIIRYGLRRNFLRISRCTTI